MRAFIIAGGKGTRMGPLTEALPKPMLKIAGKRVLEHQIECLKMNKISRITIFTGYLGGVIEDYFKNGSGFGVDIDYERETVPLGTSGCLASMRDKVREDCLVVYGDLVFDMVIENLIECHRRSSSIATIVVHPNDHPFDSDLIEMDADGNITAFILKHCKPRVYSNLANAAIYVMSKEALKYIPPDRPSDFIRDIFPEMLKSREKISGYRTTEYIKDMGTPERYSRVDADYSNGKVHRLSKRKPRPAAFMDRDGTLIKHIDQLSRATDLETFPFTARAIKKLNKAGILAIVATNQPALARNLCSAEELDFMHRRLETLLGLEESYLDGIYFCPHHPDKGWPGENEKYKIDCECRKPKTGMIDKAVADMNIDIKASWFIGDTTTDIRTGQNAGMRTVLVRTGLGGADGKFQCSPDFVFGDIDEAVDFITGQI